MAKTSNTRKARVTSDDIVMAFLLQGPSVIHAKLVDHTNPVECLNKAISKILDQNESTNVEDLRDIRAAFLRSRGNGTRGANPLSVGGSKVYSTQQVGEQGDLFIRLPVGLLVNHKGAQVKVEALDNGTFRVSAA